MRVLQLGPIPPPVGGLTRNMMAIKDELAARGDECVFIATSKSSEIVDMPDVFRPSSPFALIRLLRSLQYDILHLHIGGTIPVRVLALILVCGVIGRGKKVVSLHSGGFTETKEAKNANPFSIRGMIFRLFDRVIVVNKLLGETFKNFGVKDEKIKLILPFVLELPDQNVAIDEKLINFISRSKPFLLTVGGLEPVYDNETLIKVMQKLSSGLPDAGLMIVGSGPQEAELRQQIKQAGLDEHVMLTGNIKHKYVLHLIDKCDILLRTTLFDGDAISIREGLFLGKTVIATDNGMRPDGVQLVNKRDVDGIAAAILSPEKPPQSRSAEPDNTHIIEVLELYDGLLSQR